MALPIQAQPGQGIYQSIVYILHVLDLIRGFCSEANAPIDNSTGKITV